MIDRLQGSRNLRTLSFLLTGLLSMAACAVAAEPAGDRVGSLRLVPWPKEIAVGEQGLDLRPPLHATASDSPAARQVYLELQDELERAGTSRHETPPVFVPIESSPWLVGMASGPMPLDRLRAILDAIPEQDEGYQLVVSKDSAVVGSRSEAGLLWGIQTLRQLVRANVKDGIVPAARIRDWPTLQFRGFQDDLTRGPSTRLDVLQREVRTGSLLKMNFFTYYMEHQFAYTKHPKIYPPDGCLTADELRALVDYAVRFGLDVIGNQQSFGHFHHILSHAEYSHLAEKPHLLNPTKEETYQLLDELYGEHIPAIKSQFFNVCCDETQGLGTGPSKAVADEIGAGALYVRHIRRLHGLVTGKYGKRMMMWGDIILNHPEELKNIPKDVVMLSWGYHAADSFENAIKPFADSGFQFFICPGVNCWNRILPDFGTTAVNVRNYVRDGAKYGTLGMLNTSWDDDGENFFAPNWHGFAWGAECAWNGSATAYEDFNRRIGGVLFGEPGDEFGKAVELLAQTHNLDGYDRMFNSRFWRRGKDTVPGDVDALARQATALLAIVDPALAHLRKAQLDARVNADWLDYFIFGAERMRLMATRSLDHRAAADAYRRAMSSSRETAVVRDELRATVSRLSRVRADHEQLQDEYIQLWNRENKPHALDRVMSWFNLLLGKYDAVIAKIEQELKAPTPSTSAEVHQSILDLELGI